jgi:hypothetical protein
VLRGLGCEHASSPIGIDLRPQEGHFGVALLDQASTFDNQFDTLCEKPGEIAPGIPMMDSGKGVSLTGGATSGGELGGDLCAQPVDQRSIVATSACKASCFERERMFGFLLLSCVCSLRCG